MEEIFNILFDRGFGFVLAGIVVWILFLIVKALPKWAEKILNSFDGMTDALERQNEVTDNNTTVLEKSLSAHERMDLQLQRIEDIVTHVEQTGQNIEIALDEIKNAVQLMKEI